MQSATIILLYTGMLLRGLLMTTGIWAASVLMSLSLGFILGVAGCRRLSRKFTQPFILTYVYVLRAIPVYVQLLIVYFVIPDILRIDLPAWLAAVLALGLCSAAYMTEIVRAGMNAVSFGQWDACLVLGYSNIQALHYVIVPQMLRRAYPAVINEFESLLKSTALVSAIGVLDLTKVASNIVARTMDPLPVYLATACLYLALSAMLNIVSKILERRFLI